MSDEDRKVSFATRLKPLIPAIGVTALVVGIHIIGRGQPTVNINIADVLPPNTDMWLSSATSQALQNGESVIMRGIENPEKVLELSAKVISDPTKIAS